MIILDLKNEPVHLKRLAQWHHNEWACLNPDGSLQSRIQEMQMYLGDSVVPSTFIAKVGDELAGSAALVESDMDTHKDLSPWLASVFVNPSHRFRGVGSSLVKHVMTIAKESGLKDLYLFTPNKEAFYKHLGWTKLSAEVYRGSSVIIMSVKLNG